MKPLVKTKPAAEYLSISTRKLWELTNCGEIPHVRIGRSVRYRPEDLDAYIQRHTRGKR